MTRALALLMVALLACACARVAPPALYRPPLAADFSNAPATEQEPVAQFWRRFQDPELDALVARALAANADVRIAAASLAEARALARFADARAAPTVGLALAAARVRGPDSENVARTGSAIGVDLDMRWEADLFGAIRGERHAAAAEALAAAAQWRGVQVSVAAEVARNYFELRGQQEQLRVAVAALDTQRAALSLVDARLQAGRGNAFDSERARALVLSTEASVPALEATLARSRYRLAVLCGQLPAALDAQLAAARPLPGLAPSALDAIGSPASLLRRRPDVAAAEQQLAAAAERAGVARSALFPQLSLGGVIGLNAGSVGHLGDANAYAYNLGAQLLWSLLDFGRIRAQIAAASARGDAAAAQYEKVVLGALEETEGALASYTRNQRQSASLYGAAQSAGRAAELARARFGAGSSDFLAVLDAERESLAARDRLAQANTVGATSLVAVYKALAGGWKEDAP
ncbi:MAG: efflux transporter outer membrane subunit [Pseudomonadota bacterium]